MLKVKNLQFPKLYDIYLTCKTHKWEPYSYYTFLKLCKSYNSIIDICERDRGKQSRRKLLLSENEYENIDFYYKKWIKTYELPKYTWISIHRIYKYYINPKKALWEIS